MGAHTAAELAAAGHHVTVVTRGLRATPPNVETLVADRSDVASLALVLEGRTFDVTVDFLAYDAADIERLLLVPYAALGRFIMISTGQVYLVTTAGVRPYREADSATPMIEAPPVGSYDHANWLYGAGKRRAEEALRALRRTHGMRATALRLPIVLGEHDGSLRLWSYLERLLDGGPILIPDDAGRELRFVYAGDVARAIRDLVEAPVPRDFAFNLAQPDVVTLRELIGRLARLVGVEPAIIEVGAAELETAGIARTFSPYGSPWVSYLDPARAEEVFGFRGTGLDDYLPGVVHWQLEHRPAASHPGYAHRDAERALAARLAEVK